MSAGQLILDIADAWVAASRRTPTAFETAVLGGNFKVISRLRAGGSVTLPVLERVLFFAAEATNWPDSRVPDAILELLSLRIGDLNPNTAETTLPRDKAAGDIAPGVELCAPTDGAAA